MHEDEWDSIQRDLDQVEYEHKPCMTKVGRLISIDDSQRIAPVAKPRTKHAMSTEKRPSNNIQTRTVDDYQLVDIGPPKSRRSPDHMSVVLLQSAIPGYCSDQLNDITIPRGSLLKPLSELDDNVISSIRNKKKKEILRDDMVLRDIIRNEVVGVSSPSNFMRISDDQTLLLLPVPYEERISLYKDFERFHFLENLKPGDEVLVMKEYPNGDVGTLQGILRSVGDREKEVGHWFKIKLDRMYAEGGTRTVYAHASQILPPNPKHHDYNTPHISEARSIPIRRVEAHGQRDGLQSNSQRMAARSSYDNNQASTSFVNHKPPLYQNIQELDDHASRNYEHNEKERRSYVFDRDGENRNDWSSNNYRDKRKEDTAGFERSRPVRIRHNGERREMGQRQQPSRSHSAHSIARVHETTHAVTDPTVLKCATLGDRCCWRSGDVPHKGYIRFIGHLKGHQELYAGVEFDEPVGKGTGVFRGETVFRTQENRAGFVLLSSLEILSRSGESSHSIGYKQSSADSLYDIGRSPSSSGTTSGGFGAVYSPPPPYADYPQSSYSINPVVQSDSYESGLRQPHPPPLPPQPVFKAEDFLIDSYHIGSPVEVCHLGAVRVGFVQWLGDAMSENHDHLERSAVVQLDEDVPSGWRPSSECPDPCSQRVGNAVLVPQTALRRNRTRSSTLGSSMSDECHISPPRNGKTDFGSIDSGIETSRCDPAKDVEALLGRMKGIQGNRNSCYLDATIYAMFVQSTAFDFLLERKSKSGDIPQYGELQRILATEIVYPLRKFHYVRADHMMKLRELLGHLLPNIPGLTCEEKDPEEILAALFTTLFRAPPFVELRNVKDNKVSPSHLCPLIIDEWSGGVATTQHLLERSMKANGVKFAEPPKTLILQLPRYGQQKVLDKILPLETIDVTSVVHNAVIACHDCGKPSEGMCPECFLTQKVYTPQVSFCAPCFRRVHESSGMSDHMMKPFYPQAKPVKKPHSHLMVLSAVLCIETSHYVAFVRSSSGRWVFFDSMADREGLTDGFNVPQVKECERVSWWLSPAGWERLRTADELGNTKDILGKSSDVDPLVTRLLSDSYICFYHQDPSAATANGAQGFRDLIRTVGKNVSNVGKNVSNSIKI